MADYRAILKKVGTVLILVGLFDIAFMVYCIANQTSYSSSFNIFAVIAGILLYRGGLKTTKVVTFFSAFLLTGMGGFIIIFPLFIPPDLLLTQIKINPLSAVGYSLFAIFCLLFLIWVLKSLMSPAIYEAMDNNGINRKSFFSRPRSGAICGILLLAILGGTLPLLLKGETAEMAKIEAQKKVGDGYKFAVSTININSNFNGKTHVYAIVTAYNDIEIKQVEVQFEK
jgi:hypothetical protein